MTLPIPPNPTKKDLKRYGEAIRRKEEIKSPKKDYQWIADRILSEFNKYYGKLEWHKIAAIKIYNTIYKEAPEFNPTPMSIKFKQPKRIPRISCCDRSYRRGVWRGVFISLSIVVICQLIYLLI